MSGMFVAAVAASAALAADGGPALIGVSKDWSVYVRGKGDSKVCYALSEPKTQEPAKAKRDPAYFLINDWPGRKSKAEPEIVPGYPYGKDGRVTVKIGGAKFAFFTRNNGGDGAAWLLDPADKPHLLSALRGGSTAVVTGTSSRGTGTTDTYSLKGSTAALEKLHDACDM